MDKNDLTFLNRKYSFAKIFTQNIEDVAKNQIQRFIDTFVAKDTKVRIMPDVHAGKGCVIGFTCSLNDYIIPQIIGVDVGCGILALKISDEKLSNETLEKFDVYLKTNIPSGFNIHENISQFVDRDIIEKIWNSLIFKPNLDYMKRACGSLGGNNHFIECSIDEQNATWLVIHSGSRKIGIEVCGHYQDKAKKTLTLEDFQKAMEGIYSTTVDSSTLDEAPMAYKSASEIIRLINDTVEVKSILKPIYNFKASEK